MAIKTAFFALAGGLDLVTPPISTPSGRAISGLNYEPDVRGYVRTRGHERFDGRSKPSNQSYWTLGFTAGTQAIPVGSTVTGATSAATGIVVVAGVVESGSYAGTDAAGYLIVRQVTGSFANGENLQVAAATKAVADGIEALSGAPNDPLNDAYTQAAIEHARALIGEPAGSGPIRGGFVYNGDTYCFRDNGPGTAGLLFKESATGWQVQSLGYTLQYDASVGEIFEGDTVVGGTSGASAVVKRVTLESGVWGASGTGRLVFASITGTFQNNEALKVATVTKATANLTVTTNSLPPGGRYECVTHNFYGASNRRRIYGANGVGKAFDWDGSVLALINTGMTVDTPSHIGVQKNQLFLTFTGGSLQNSSVGEPHMWDAITGATEIGLGEEITALLPDVQGAMVVFGRNLIAILYGNDREDFTLDILNAKAGAAEWSVQMVGMPMYLDDQGIRSLSAAQVYGDFRMGSITQLVAPLLRRKRAANIQVVASIRSRARDQYRVFFSDGSGLCIYFGRKAPECMPFDYGVVVTSCWAGEDDNGNEILFIGDSDGLVYQLESGTSFDGTAVNAYIRLAFNNIGTPQQNKRFQSAALEVDAAPNTELGLTAEYSYGDPDQPAGQEQRFAVSGSGGIWDEAFWDQFYWSSPIFGLARADIDGFGRNISIAIASSEAYREPHTLTGMTLFFNYRGLAR